MIDTPFLFEEKIPDADFQTIGKLALRWAHIEHILGNCLKVLLRLSDEEAGTIVFPMSLDERLQKIKAIAKLNGLTKDGEAALQALTSTLGHIKGTRNNLIHAVVVDDGEELHFEWRAKGISRTKSEILSVEELVNYAAHAAIALRLALGMKGQPDASHSLPKAPPIPKFLGETKGRSGTGRGPRVRVSKPRRA